MKNHRNIKVLYININFVCNHELNCNNEKNLP